MKQGTENLHGSLSISSMNLLVSSSQVSLIVCLERAHHLSFAQYITGIREKIVLPSTNMK